MQRSLVLVALLLAACGADVVQSDDLTAETEKVSASQDVTRALPSGSVLGADTNVNLRTGPATSYRVILVIPSGAHSTVVDGQPDHGWYKVDHAGHTGYTYGAYHHVVSTPSSGGGGGGSSGGGSAGDFIVERAKTSVGFSYHWGHGAWQSGARAGSCQGACPNCSHSGSYGADCSGMVAKAMKVPDYNTDFGKDAHPYSTWNFYNEARQWSHVARGTSYDEPGDAFVWNSGSEGHTFIYERGDAWGTLLAVECKGCSYGCVRGYRTAFSGYKVIRRHGVSGAERLADEADGSLASSR